MVDYTLSPNGQVVHVLPDIMDNCLLYVYKGSVTIGGTTISSQHCVRMNVGEEGGSSRHFTISSSIATGASIILFAGRMLHQPIAWHGPFVMTTDEEIRQTLTEYREGRFFRKRASWDYKRIATKPKI